MKKLPVILSLLFLMAGMGTARASSITLDLNHPTVTVYGQEVLAIPGSGTYDYAASATFTLTRGSSFNTLTLVLTNTSSQAVTDPAQLLSGIFWNSSTTLTPVLAGLTSGSQWINPNDVNLNVGGNYSYNSALPLTGTNPAPASQGVSSVGLGLFNKGNFGSPGVSVQGDNYDLLPASGIAGNGVAFIKKYPLANDSMTFTFHTTANAVSIGDVYFHYSSEYTGLNLPDDMPPAGGGNNVPLPPTALLLGSGLLGLVLLRGRRTNQA